MAKHSIWQMWNQCSRVLYYYTVWRFQRGNKIWGWWQVRRSDLDSLEKSVFRRITWKIPRTKIQCSLLMPSFASNGDHFCEKIEKFLEVEYSAPITVVMFPRTYRVIIRICIMRSLKWNISILYARVKCVCTNNFEYSKWNFRRQGVTLHTLDGWMCVCTVYPQTMTAVPISINTIVSCVIGANTHTHTQTHLILILQWDIECRTIHKITRLYNKIYWSPNAMPRSHVSCQRKWYILTEN